MPLFNKAIRFLLSLSVACILLLFACTPLTLTTPEQSIELQFTDIVFPYDLAQQDSQSLEALFNYSKDDTKTLLLNLKVRNVNERDAAKIYLNDAFISSFFEHKKDLTYGAEISTLTIELPYELLKLNSNKLELFSTLPTGFVIHQMNIVERVDSAEQEETSPLQPPTPGVPNTDSPPEQPDTPNETNEPSKPDPSVPNEPSEPNEPSNPSEPEPPNEPNEIADLQELISRETFYSLFPTLSTNGFSYLNQTFFSEAHSIYTYDAFIEATKSFPEFASIGSKHDRVRELAAFLANVGHETSGGWGSFAFNSARYAFGMQYLEEAACKGKSCLQYCDTGQYNPWAYSCQFNISYHGRGPLQTTWNSNYGYISEYFNLIGPQGNKDLLLYEPQQLLANGTLGFQAALWYWMTPLGQSPSSHSVITGQWTANSNDLSKGRAAGFGMTINIINGKLECNQVHGDRQKSRVGHYINFLSQLGGQSSNNKLLVSPKVNGSHQDSAFDIPSAENPDRTLNLTCDRMQSY